MYTRLAVKCPAGQVFEECGDECFRTCADLQSTTPCKTGCVEGCRCPLGQALHESNECVPIASCPCVYKGLEFKPGYKEVRAGTKYLELWLVLVLQINCRDRKRLSFFLSSALVSTPNGSAERPSATTKTNIRQPPIYAISVWLATTRSSVPANQLSR